MPSGRKSGTKVKGGGFGRSLLNARSKTGLPTSAIAHDKPDYTRVRIQFKEHNDEQPSLTDFISKEKVKVSRVDGDAFDEFLAASFTHRDDSNLVIMQSSGAHLAVCPEPEIVSRGNDTTNKRSSLLGPHSIFGSSGVTGRTQLASLGCPERPFAFRDPPSRVISFARFLARRISPNNEDGDEEAQSDLVAICQKVSKDEVMATVEEYFLRRENSAVFLTAKALEKAEAIAFARWRSSIADSEAKICVTPYEKNFEYWKQLWRTIERSDVVLEIVDARNPLLFAAPSLKALTERQGRQHYILMNKADFLSPEELRAWRSYFESRQQNVLFYSALRELENQRLHLKSVEESSHGVKLTKSALRQHESSFKPVKTEDQLLDGICKGSSPEAAPSSASPPMVDEDDEGLFSAAPDQDRWITGCAPTTEKMRDKPELYKDLVMNADELGAFLDEKSLKMGAVKWQAEHLATQLWDILNQKLAEISYRDKKALYQKLWLHANQNAEECERSIDQLDHPLITESDTFSDQEGSERSELPADEENSSDGTLTGADDSSEEGDHAKLGDDKKGVDRTSQPKDTGDTNQVKLPKNLNQMFLRILLGPRRIESDEASMCYSSPIIGTCGYPNVGKSSVINSLMKGTKRVGVSRTPGKTRHLQTLQVPHHQFVLCDCPGLIFPSAAASKEVLLLNNILSPSTFRGSLLPAMSLLLEKLGAAVGKAYGVETDFYTLERTRGRTLSELALECATIIARKKKYFAGGRGGVPDIQRTCREVLKELHKGIVMWFNEPPPPCQMKFRTKFYPYSV